VVSRIATRRNCIFSGKLVYGPSVSTSIANVILEETSGDYPPAAELAPNTTVRFDLKPEDPSWLSPPPIFIGLKCEPNPGSTIPAPCIPNARFFATKKYLCHPAEDVGENESVQFRYEGYDQVSGSHLGTWVCMVGAGFSCDFTEIGRRITRD
jgi:hypothetical protein